MNKTLARGLRTVIAVSPWLATSLSLAQTAAAPAKAKPLAFTIVSVKLHGNASPGTEGCNVDACHFTGVDLLSLINAAYSISGKLIFGAPSWATEDRFDLDAKIDSADLPAPPPSRLQLIEMLQPVLVDRFHLHVHHETRAFPAYNLVLGKRGTKLKPATVAATGPCQVRSQSNGALSLHNCWMDAIAHWLWTPSGRTVVDKTGLSGRYDVELHWTPDNTPADPTLAGGPSIFTAVQEQLGLKLEPSTAQLDALVIDSAQKPSAN